MVLRHFKTFIAKSMSKLIIQNIYLMKLINLSVTECNLKS